VVFGLERRVRRTGAGRYQLRLPPAERELLRQLPSQLRELLAGDDPSLRRLFPAAYPDDPQRDAEFRRLVHDDLVARRLAALEVVESTVDAREVDEEQLTAWMGALNDLRLVLGTRLDVSEETADHPDAAAFAVYSYLGLLQEQVVAALDPEYG
jgi:Domain of unknown function (DUF2017)